MHSWRCEILGFRLRCERSPPGAMEAGIHPQDQFANLSGLLVGSESSLPAS